MKKVIELGLIILLDFSNYAIFFKEFSMSTFSFKGIANDYEVSKLLADLIKIESINMDYPGSTKGEFEISKYIHHYFTKLGIDCISEEVLPGRSNIICFMQGKDRRGLFLESHMDTVSIEGMDIEPLNPIIKEGKMYGRGSADDKGSLAAMMIAIKNLVKYRIKPSTDVYFIASVDEECQHRGVDHFLKKRIKAQGAVIGEPTQLNVVTACKGVVRWRIISRGKAGHSSRPEKGHNAIYDMVDLIYTMKKDLIPSIQNKKHELLGAPSLSVGCIKGGTAVNIIPDQCSIEVDRRLLPNESNEGAREEIFNIIHEMRKNNKNINIDVSEPTTYTIPIDTDINHRVVKVAIESCKKIYGNGKVEGADFGCNASSFTKAGIPSIVLGPGNILQAHTKDEFVSLREVCKAAEIYSQICIDF